MKHLRAVITAYLVALVGLAATPTTASALSFGLNTEFSGATAPAGMTPWVTATFTDIAGGVRLTIAAVNLTGSEFISGFYVNFDPSKDVTLLSYAVQPSTQTAFNSIDQGANAYQADGDGKFDIQIDFPPPPGDAASKFTAGEAFVVDFLGLGVTMADFDFLSVDGPVGKTGFPVAAHIQGIGPDGNDSGWITGPKLPDTGIVPLPSTLALLGAGLFGFAWVRRR